jgi:CHAT domain-containing protein
LELGRALDAFMWAERDRARQLRDQLALIPVAPPHTVPQRLAAEERALITGLRECEAAIQNASDEIDQGPWLHHVNTAAVTRERLSRIWDEMSRDYGAAEYVAKRRSDPATWDRIQRWLGSQGRRIAIISYYGLGEEQYAFVAVTGQKVPECVRLPTSRQDVLEAAHAFVDDIHGSTVGGVSNWQELGAALLEPLLPSTRGADLLYVVPHGVLHFLPIHALSVGGQELIRRVSVAYSPSVDAILRTTTRERSTSIPEPDDVLAVGCGGANESFATEAAAVASLFGASPILSKDATPTTVAARLSRATLAHFSTHANFHLEYPLESGIDLADGERITVREMAPLQMSADLVVLSSCESGMHAVGHSNNLVGMPAALLSCGAGAVIASLWRVQALVSVQLMSAFYRAMYGTWQHKTACTADALRTAMIELADDGCNVREWAPFLLYGDWR